MYWVSYLAIITILGGLGYAYLRRAYLSLTFAVANILIFIMMVLTSPFQRFVFLSPIFKDLAFLPLSFSRGENLYTIVTSTFLHLDILHLAINMAALVLIGTVFEERIGTLRFTLLYFLTGFIGTLSFAVFNWGQNAVVVGASGAISGIFGAFAKISPRERIMLFLPFGILPPIPVYVLVILYLLISSFLLLIYPGGIAHEAHIAGALSGWFLAPLVMKIELRRTVRTGDLSPLEVLATTSELKDILRTIEGENLPEVRNAWLERFINRSRCTECGGDLRKRGRKILSKCGWKIKLE